MSDIAYAIMEEMQMEVLLIVSQQVLETLQYRTDVVLAVKL